MTVTILAGSRHDPGEGFWRVQPVHAQIARFDAHLTRKRPELGDPPVRCA